VAATLRSVDARSKLKPRREPYWETVRKGCYVGFRLLTKGAHGTWIARWRDEATRKQHYNSLGSLEHLPASERRDAAGVAAEAWFKHVGAGGRTEAATVKWACKAYVDHLRSERGDAAADDAEARFKRWIDDDPKLAPIELTKLQPQALLGWRKRLTAEPVRTSAKQPAPLPDDETPRARSKSSINRDMTSLRAALNHARTVGAVMTDAAWREALRPHKNADGRRDIYLELEQRQRWVDNADPDVADLLQALSLVPLRPGALAGLDVADLDRRLGALRVGQDKAGNDRKLPLPAATAAFFAARAKGALAAAPLLRRADGTRWNKDAWKGPVKDAALAAKLPTGATAYTLRHSVITDLVHSGLDTLTVAQLSGTSVAMIEKHYGHLRAEHARTALATLTISRKRTAR
jgi:site-specific recombinase XerD